MNPILLALAIAAAPLVYPPPTIPPAMLDDTLEVTGESIDAQRIETRMAVDVRVNGQGPFRFIVDSGADRSVVGAALARRLALPAAGWVTLNGMAGASRVDTVRLDELSIGESAISHIVAPALPERHIGAQGLLGIDALAGQRLMLDFEKKAITVQDARRPTPAQPGEIVVTARRRNGQLILTQATVEGRPVHAVIDTGAQVTVGNSALLARLARSRHPPGEGLVTLVSVTGATIEAKRIVLPQLRIGGMIVQDMPIAFVDAPPFALFGLDKQPALLLGSDVLEAFRRVSLDFRNRKVRFVLRR